MAVFGAPQSHEDDPERAVRAALSIRDWAHEEDADLQVRIGVNTGEVLVTLGAQPSQGEAMVAGDAVNSVAEGAAGLYTNPAPGLVNANNQDLAENIDRRALNVDRILPLHGRVSPMAEFLSTVVRKP